MKEFVCIVCPRGCNLKVDGDKYNLTVTGNSCKRGKDFAVSEMTEPKRTICSTVRTAYCDVPVLPVRVSADIPKDRIFDVMKEINKVLVDKPLCRGDKVIENVLGLNADIIATSDILKNM